MEYGIGLIAGLFVVWAMAAAGAGWPPDLLAPAGAIAALASGVLAARLGAGDREGAWTSAPAALFHAMAGFPARFLAAASVAASALGVRRPRAGLVRITLRADDDHALGRVIEALGARADLVVVDADAGSVLAHAHDEDSADVEALRKVARRVMGGAQA